MSKLWSRPLSPRWIKTGILTYQARTSKVRLMLGRVMFHSHLVGINGIRAQFPNLTPRTPQIYKTTPKSTRSKLMTTDQNLLNKGKAGPRQLKKLNSSRFKKMESSLNILITARHVTRRKQKKKERRKPTYRLRSSRFRNSEFCLINT
jgi:hypothetical protein